VGRVVSVELDDAFEYILRRIKLRLKERDESKVIKTALMTLYEVLYAERYGMHPCEAVLNKSRDELISELMKR